MRDIKRTPKRTEYIPAFKDAKVCRIAVTYVKKFKRDNIEQFGTHD